MHRTYSLIPLVVALWVTASRAQDFPLLHPGDVSAATIVKTDYYAGKALFGYIDGGAELYLEYGFQRLGRQEVTFPDGSLVVEVYQMAGPNESYGIFSIQRFKCAPVDSDWTNTCQTRYQLQAVVGSYYLSIVNQSGTQSARDESKKIFKAIRKNITPEKMTLPSLFDNKTIQNYRPALMIMCGTLGLQNGFAEWEDLFQDIQKFSLEVIPIEQGSERCVIAHIRFASAGDALKFCTNAGFLTPTVGSIVTTGSSLLRTVKRIDGQQLIYIETPASFQNRNELVDRLLR